MNLNIKQLLQSSQSAQNINIKQIFRKTSILLNIAIFVIALISIKVIYQKQAMQAKSLQKQIKETEEKINIIKKFESSEKEIRAYLKRVPAGKDLSDIIATVTDIAYSNNIKITTISPEKIKYTQQYYMLPLTLSLYGTYYDIWNFLRDIENSEEIFTLENVGIQGSKSSLRFAGDRGDNYYSVTIRLFATSIKRD